MAGRGGQVRGRGLDSSVWPAGGRAPEEAPDDLPGHPSNGVDGGERCGVCVHVACGRHRARGPVAKAREGAGGRRSAQADAREINEVSLWQDARKGRRPHRGVLAELVEGSNAHVGGHAVSIQLQQAAWA